MTKHMPSSGDFQDFRSSPTTDDDFDSIEAVFENEMAKDPQMRRKFRMKRSLSFHDPDIESKFQNRLKSRHFLFKSTIFSLVFVIGLVIAMFEDYFDNDDVKTRISERRWVEHATHSMLLTVSIAATLLLSFPLWIENHAQGLRAFVHARQQEILLGSINIGGFLFSIQYFAHNPEDGLHWSFHALVLFALFAFTRAHWKRQLASGIIQLIVFGLCTGLGNFPSNDVIECCSYLFLFGVVGCLGMFSWEHSSRVVFLYQEVSLALVKRHVSELKKLAVQAHQGEEAKSRFLANMSHEIRTPLHGVITSLELLKATEGMTDEQVEYVETAETSATNLLEILNSILTISKLEAGKLVLDHKPLDLRTTVENVAVVFCQIASRKGVEVAVYVPPSLPTQFLSDNVRLKQILFNLASNAVKFTQQGHVLIRVIPEDNSNQSTINNNNKLLQTKNENENENENEETGGSIQLTFEVQDSGVGIAHEHTHLLFQRFCQVDESSTRKFQGTGLGLALVHELSHLFNGTVGVTSRGLNQGCTFQFTARFDLCPASPPSSHRSSMAKLSEWETKSDFSLLKRLSLSSFSFPAAGGIGVGGVCGVSPIPRFRWMSVSIHPTPEISEIWKNYANFFRLSCVSNSAFFDRSRLLNLIKEHFSSCVHDSTRELVFVPFVIFLDESFLQEIEVIESLNVFQDMANKMNSVSGNLYLSPVVTSVPVCQLFVIITSDPSEHKPIPSSLTTNPQNYRTMKKPCLLKKMAQSLEDLHSFLVNLETGEVGRTAAGGNEGRRGSNLGSADDVFLGRRGSSRRTTRDFSSASGFLRASSQSIFVSADDAPHFYTYNGDHLPTPTTDSTSSRRVSMASTATTHPSISQRFAHHDHHNHHHPSQDHGNSSHHRFSHVSSDVHLLNALVFDDRPVSPGTLSSNSMTEIPPTFVMCHAGGNTSSSISTKPSPHNSEHDLEHILVDNEPSSPTSQQTVLKQPLLLSSPHTNGPTLSRLLSAGDSTFELHKRILIVDDNPVNRKLTLKLLSKAGFHCSTAENGKVAVDMACEDMFAIIFMDITMPVMDGCTATRLIQDHQRMKNTNPMTFICALSAADTDRRTADFDEMLTKPIQSEELIRTAKRLSKLWHRNQKESLNKELEISQKVGHQRVPSIFIDNST